MKTKNKILQGTFLFSLLLCLAVVSATVTINTPTSGLAVNGTYVFNATTDQAEALNCTFATTGDGTFAVIANSTADQTEFTSSNNTALLTEALATTLTVTCTNSSNDAETATVSFDIDNTAPTCSFVLSQDFVERQSALGIAVQDLSSDTTTLTYSYVLTNSDGTTKATSSSSEPTFSNGHLEDLGEHTLTLTLTDEVSKTSSCSDTFLVKGSGDNSDDTISIIKDITINKDIIIVFIVIGVVILIILIAVIYWFATSKTKRR